METKVCIKCKNEFPITLDYWHKQPRGKYGLRTKCKKCACQEQSLRRSTAGAKEKHRIQMGKWRENNPDKQAEIRKKSYEKNKDRLNMERRERYKTDPEYKSKKMECEIRYRSSGRRYEVSSTPSQRMKSRIRSRVRRQNPELRRRDNEHNAQYREIHKDNIRNRHKKRRQELVDSYVAHVMHISLRDIPPEIIETKRLIIKLRRELRSNNIKIRQL